MGLMGNFVSTLEKPPTDDKDVGTIHGFALEDDLKRLTEFLDANPAIDLDRRDEYVCNFRFVRVLFLASFSAFRGTPHCI